LTTLRTITDQASEFGGDAKESIEELRRSASTKLDAARDETADALHAAAASVRAAGRQGSEAIDNIAEGAADRLHATAAYVEDRDLSEMITGLRRFGRRHLTGCLLAAGVAGLAAGIALSRTVYSSQKRD
jgi:hypothetical protein